MFKIALIYTMEMKIKNVKNVIIFVVNVKMLIPVKHAIHRFLWIFQIEIYKTYVLVKMGL